MTIGCEQNTIKAGDDGEFVCGMEGVGMYAKKQ